MNESKIENKEKLEKAKKAVIPTNDFVFKKIFGKVGNENITKSFLSSILEDEIKTINLEGNTILDGDILTEKMSILDVRATLNSNVEVDVEMQISSQRYVEERLLYYWARLYNKTVPKGEFYEKSKRTIAILIADFEIEKLKEIEKYHTKWKIKETEFSQKVLTEKFEIDIIELPKARRYIEKQGITKNKELETWIKFLTNPESLEVAEVNENEEVKQAQEELEKLKQDEIEAWKAEMRLKYKADERIRLNDATERGHKEGLERGLKEGIEQGIEQGIKEGIKQGSQSKQIEIARNMLEQKIDIDSIVICTGLTKEEIEELKSE